MPPSAHPPTHRHPQRVKEWAAAVEKAVPVTKVSDGELNGMGFGAKQFIAMRATTWEATPVGKANGQ